MGFHIGMNAASRQGWASTLVPSVTGAGTGPDTRLASLKTAGWELGDGRLQQENPVAHSEHS